MPPDSQQLVPARDVAAELDELVALLPASLSVHRQQRLKHQLLQWVQMAQGAYASNTLRAWRSDWRVFAAFAQRENLLCLPATPETVRRFVLGRAATGSKVSTIRRSTATITRMHKAAGLPDPVAQEPVRLAKREVARKLGTRQRQARGLVWAEISGYLALPPQVLRDHRDRAMACVAYDALLRSEELISLNVEHLTWDPDGSATMLIAKSKTDQEGEGAVAYLAPNTVALLKEWLRRAGISEGALFRRVTGYTTLGDRLSTQSVTDVFQRIGKQIGLENEQWKALSGHSARVGADQDLFEHNTDLASVMQQGRWKDPRMPVRYAEHLIAKQGAMARMAALQGRAIHSPSGKS